MSQPNFPGDSSSNFPADVFWDVDGVSLQTYAFNIESLGGSRLTMPPPRGSNQAIPFLSGQRYLPKFPDSRTLTLAMWVQGSDERGNPPTDIGLRLQYERNYRKLRKLLWVYGRQMMLTKRFLDDDGNIVTATALAEFTGGLEITKEGGPYRGKFTVDLLLADPFFYGAPVVISPTRWGVNTPVAILGDYASSRGTLVLKPTLNVVNPRFYLGSDWVSVNTTLVAHSTLTLDLGRWNAYYTSPTYTFYSGEGGVTVLPPVAPPPGTTNINNLIVKSTPHRWLVATPGVQQFRATVPDITGIPGKETIMSEWLQMPVITYSPAYL